MSEIELIHSFNCGGRVCELFYFLCLKKDIKSNCIRLDLYFVHILLKKRQGLATVIYGRYISGQIAFGP